MKDPNDGLFADVEEILYKRGHREVKVYQVYGPGDPESAFDPFGKPATTALFVDKTKKARTALVYTEAVVVKGDDGENTTTWRPRVIVRDGWLAVVE